MFERVSKSINSIFSWEQEKLLSCSCMLCIIFLWFFSQGNGTAALAPADMASFVGLLDTLSFGLGGLLGSFGFLLVERLLGNRFDESATAQPLRRAVSWRWLAWSSLAIVIFSCLSLALTLNGAFLLAFLCRVLVAGAITVVFLESCRWLFSFDAISIFLAFSAVAAFRILQGALVLPFGLPLSNVIVLEVFQIACAVLLCVLGRRFYALSAKSAATSSPADSAPGEETTEAEAPSMQAPLFDLRTNRLPWQFIVHVMLFYFVLTAPRLWQSSLVGSSMQAALLGILASSLSCILFYLAFSKAHDSQNYWARIRQIAFPLIFLSFPLARLFDVWGALISVLAVQTGYRFFLLSSYVEMFAICKTTRINSDIVFAITHAAMYVGVSAGAFVGYATSGYAVFNDHANLFITVVAFILLIAASCWLGSDKQAAKIWGRRIELTPKGRRDELLQKKYGSISARYSLTPKEAEMLPLLIEGKKIALIADQLVVSSSTVRTHVRNLYTKLDVHSREDLSRFFDSYSIEED